MRGLGPLPTNTPEEPKLSTGADSGEFRKLAKHCFANMIVSVKLAKLSEIFKVADRIALPKVFHQIAGQLFQKLRAVCRAFCAVFLFLNAPPVNLKIGIDHRKMDCRFRLLCLILKLCHDI